MKKVIDIDEVKEYISHCGPDTKIYLGSTIQSLAVRLAGHKRDSKTERCMNIKLYIEVNNDWNNWYIELHE